MRDLRCQKCGRRIGITVRSQAVPVQCTDPFCAEEMLPSKNEARDSYIETVFLAGVTPNTIGKEFGMTRQNVERVLANR